MNALSDWRISDLSDQNKVNTLRLCDVLEIDENSAQILRSLPPRGIQCDARYAAAQQNVGRGRTC